MDETTLHEKLHRVLVRYEGGRIEPIEFQWGAREFRVRAVNARWVDRATRPVRWFFSVTAESGEIFTLAYREGEPIWYVEGVVG
ncbi:MAG: hypothetical protein HYY17_11640 [Planctomycetes bacterium]|nr:hypothetical protein [Planctomycetota bacterium]